MALVTKEQIEQIIKQQQEQIAELRDERAKTMQCVGKLKSIIEPLLPKDGKTPGIGQVMGIAQKLMQKQSQQALTDALLPLIESYEKYEVENNGNA